MRKISALVVTVALGGVAAPAHSAYIITFQEVGPNVISTGTGSLNFSALSLFSTSAGSITPQIRPNSAQAAVGGGFSDFYQFAFGPNEFSVSNTFTARSANSFTGNIVGIGNGSNAVVFVPQLYQSGGNLGNSTAIYNNSTLASLDLASGTYVWNWGEGITADSFTVQIGNSVPEPTTWAMMFVGFGAIGFAMRRRRQQPKVQFAF